MIFSLRSNFDSNFFVQTHISLTNPESKAMNNINIFMALIMLFFLIFWFLMQMEIIKRTIIHQLWHPVTIWNWLTQICIHLIYYIPLRLSWLIEFYLRFLFVSKSYFSNWNDSSKSRSYQLFWWLVQVSSWILNVFVLTELL
jgi:uncharacterized protein with PQ loop repeat